MDIKKFITIIWHGKWIILVTTLITTLVIFAGLQFYNPLYEASATLRVATSRTGQASYEDLLYADRLLKTFAQIASGSSVKEDLVRMYYLEDEPEIEAQVLPNTELLRLTVRYTNPALARDIANTLASVVIRRSHELDNRFNMVTIVDEAVTPKAPTFSRMIILALGVLIGFSGGLGLAFLFEVLEKRLYTSKQIEQASESTLLGSIPSVRKTQSILLRKNSPRFYEVAFQNLRTHILMQNHSNPLKTLLVTSANPGEGKSTVLINLATSIARTGDKVVLVDADLRKPKLHSLCQIPNEVGLSDILADSLVYTEAFQTVDTNISLISAGPPPDDPTSLLISENIFILIEELKTLFDYVLIDSPAILAVPDAELLASHVDGLIFVVNGATATEETIHDARKMLVQMPARLLGIVVNKATLNHNYYYYHA